MDVIKEVRSEAEFAKLPIIVFSNTYLTNLIQEAWKAGANKCLSKASCSPKEILDIVRHTIGDSGSMPKPQPLPDGGPEKKAGAATPAGGESQDTVFQADLRKSFVDSLPATLATLRAGLQSLVKADDEMAQLKQIYELYRRLHALTGNAGITGLTRFPRCPTPSRRCSRSFTKSRKTSMPPRSARWRRAWTFSACCSNAAPRRKSRKPRWQTSWWWMTNRFRGGPWSMPWKRPVCRRSTPKTRTPPYKLLEEKKFDLVFLDVDMPGMTGYELCAKLRNLAHHKKTPVVFVTALSDFDSRTNSMMAGGNDFIAKPFLFIELTVKALIHVLRARFQPAK